MPPPQEEAAATLMFNATQFAPPRPKQFPPGARYLALPGVGHSPTWDDPGLIARVLLEGSAAGALAR